MKQKTRLLFISRAPIQPKPWPLTAALLYLERQSKTWEKATRMWSFSRCRLIRAKSSWPIACLRDHFRAAKVSQRACKSAAKLVVYTMLRANNQRVQVDRRLWNIWSSNSWLIAAHLRRLLQHRGRSVAIWSQQRRTLLQWAVALEISPPKSQWSWLSRWGRRQEPALSKPLTWVASRSRKSRLRRGYRVRNLSHLITSPSSYHPKPRVNRRRHYTQWPSLSSRCLRTKLPSTSTSTLKTNLTICKRFHPGKINRWRRALSSSIKGSCSVEFRRPLLNVPVTLTWILLLLASSLVDYRVKTVIWRKTQIKLCCPSQRTRAISEWAISRCESWESKYANF